MSVDLSTTYLGLELSSPVVASASPLTGDLDMLRRLEQAGAGAVVLPSLFEEQVEHEQAGPPAALEHGGQAHEALGYFPEMDAYNAGPEEYADHVAQAKRALAIPVIASLNGVTPGGWTRYAELLQRAGADAIELNVGLRAWLLDRGYASVRQLQGSMSQIACGDPRAFERAHYVRALVDFPVRTADLGAPE